RTAGRGGLRLPRRWGRRDPRPSRKPTRRALHCGDACGDGEIGVHWILAIVGAVVGAVLSAGDAILLGLFAGALLGWQGARLAQLRQRLVELEGGAPVAVPATAAPPAPAPVAATAAAAPVAATAAAAPPTPVPTPAAASGAVPPAPAATTAASPAPVRTPPPAPPRRHRPALGERLARLLRRWFMEGNVPAKVGALVTFFAVGAGLKLAVDEGWVTLPIEFRLTGIAAAAIAALAWGWPSRAARPVLAVTLQGLA